MGSLRFGGKHLSTLLILIIGGIFLAVVVVVLVVSYMTAQRTREYMLRSQTLQTAPITPTQRQVKRIWLERDTSEGVEYIEVLWNGEVNVYDRDRRLKRSGLQGFARLNQLFDDIVKHWDDFARVPNGKYRITIETNLDTLIIPGGGGGGDSDFDDIIDELDDIIDDTLAPTPTRIPTITPYPGQPSPTPTITPTPYIPPPTISWAPGSPTPTPLPEYMTAPPFSCKDYRFNRPFAISNVICGAD